MKIKVTSYIDKCCNEFGELYIDDKYLEKLCTIGGIIEIVSPKNGHAISLNDDGTIEYLPIGLIESKN